MSATSAALQRRQNRVKLNVTSVMGINLRNRNWCNLQNPGFKFQELQDLIFYAKFYKKQKEAQGKVSHRAVQEWTYLAEACAASFGT
jgi:hypothetical protein